MFMDAGRFGFPNLLEENWRSIRTEFEALAPTDLREWPEKSLYGKGWDVFGLYFFRKRLDDNCGRCPITAKVVESVPGMITAGFSVMAPATHIRPHKGYTDKVLRCHLGLIVPAGCGIRVGTESRSWTEGRVFVFDDTVEHEAWNDSDLPRVVLLLDFIKHQ